MDTTKIKREVKTVSSLTPKFTAAIGDVMDGELDSFIEAYLRQENQLVEA